MHLLTLVALALLSAPQEPPDAPPADAFKPPAGWKELGPSLWFDPETKSLRLRARVCLREGFLEHLLCLNRTKEHEAILATPAPPRMIHAGLLLTGAEPGRPVQFQPEFRPPTGSSIAIEVSWEEGGQPRQADARTWVREEKTGKPLEVHWVFAGSLLLRSGDGQREVYAADQGDLITVANFPEAILDVPISSSQSDTQRLFVAATDQIPPLNTWVTLTLKPTAAAR